MCTMKEKGKTFLSNLIKTMFFVQRNLGNVWLLFWLYPLRNIPARIDTTVSQNVECLVLI
jgi:hypothetical protein